MSMRKYLTFRYSGSGPVGLIAVLLLGLLATSCGKKTFPKPILQEPPPQITDLKIEVLSNGVELSWSVPERKSGSEEPSTYRFAVMKSEVPWDKRNCLECPPPEQTTALTIDPAYPHPATIKGNSLVVTDALVSLDHAYRYQISVRNKKGRELSISNPAIAKVVPPAQPPQDFSAVQQAQGILLRWKVPKKDNRGQPLAHEPQFRIQRRLAGGPWETISPAPVTGDSFFDPAVASNEIYDYRALSLLSFEGTSIWSEPSAMRQVKAPGALPPPPPNTVWAIPAQGSLEVHWTPTEGKTTGYHVYRREGKEIVRLTSNPVPGPPYVDQAVKQNVVYFYAVSAVGVDPPHPEGLLSKWAEIRNLQFQ